MMSVKNQTGGKRIIPVKVPSAVILFPSHVPAGPSTTLYTGRLVYTVDTSTGVITGLYELERGA